VTSIWFANQTQRSHVLQHLSPSLHGASSAPRQLRPLSHWRINRKDRFGAWLRIVRRDAQTFAVFDLRLHRMQAIPTIPRSFKIGLPVLTWPSVEPLKNRSMELGEVIPTANPSEFTMRLNEIASHVNREKIKCHQRFKSCIVSPAACVIAPSSDRSSLPAMRPRPSLSFPVTLSHLFYACPTRLRSGFTNRGSGQ
jgi:hypothetical protein